MNSIRRLLCINILCSAIWCFGTGGGSFGSAGSVGTTTDFLTKPMRAAFTMLFGSYFIDWDSNNNFLRAPLAGSHALTSISSGRPYAFFHHMGAGYHTGFSAHQSQANYYKYTNAVSLTYILFGLSRV